MINIFSREALFPDMGPKKEETKEKRKKERNMHK